MLDLPLGATQALCPGVILAMTDCHVDVNGCHHFPDGFQRVFLVYQLLVSLTIRTTPFVVGIIFRLNLLESISRHQGILEGLLIIETLQIQYHIVVMLDCSLIIACFDCLWKEWKTEERPYRISVKRTQSSCRLPSGSQNV